MLIKDLEVTLEELEEEIEKVEDEISAQESIIEDAEAYIEDFTNELDELKGERQDLEELKAERDIVGRAVGVVVRLEKITGKYSVVRDPHEKLGFYNHEPSFISLVVTDEGVWGCQDLFPHKDSELTFLTGVVE